LAANFFAKLQAFYLISYYYAEPLFLGGKLRAGVENVPGQLQAGGQISRGLLLLLHCNVTLKK
jgi:hypothetical protein